MAMTALPPPISPWTLLTEWTLHPTVLPALFAGLLYSAAVRRVRSAGRAWSRARQLAFQVGSVVVVLAVGSPIDAYADVSFSVHMVQHLLLTIVAPPLLALGAPVTLALRASRPEVARRLARMLGSSAVSAITHPVVGWASFALVPFVMHFSPLYQAALTDGWIHAFEHVLLFGSGLLFWWPVVGVDPMRRRMHPAARILSLMLAMPAQSFLALAIFSAPRPLYDAYSSLPVPFGPTALSDQRQAASIMWVFGSLLLVLATLIVASHWHRSEQDHEPVVARPTPPTP